MGLRRIIFDESGDAHFYDQIAWSTRGKRHRPVLTLDTAEGGQVDFVGIIQDDRTLARCPGPSPTMTVNKLQNLFGAARTFGAGIHIEPVPVLTG